MHAIDALINQWYAALKVQASEHTDEWYVGRVGLAFVQIVKRYERNKHLRCDPGMFQV